jgi:uncharacterized lipoprotein NlpE involved in copper resistance
MYLESVTILDGPFDVGYWTRPVLFLALVLATGCRVSQPALPAKDTESKSSALPEKIPSPGQIPQLLGIYTGTLPCADCRGIRTELSIYVKGSNRLAGGTYRLKETHLGTPDGNQTFESVGQWTLLRGNMADPNATIYQLNYDQPRDVRNFLRISDEEIRLLDRQQNEIHSQANLTLRRVQSTLVGGYLPVDPADDRVRAAADFAVADEARRLSQIIDLRSLASAEQQIVAGTNYRLWLKVASGTSSRCVEAVVFQNLKGQYSLNGWTDRLARDATRPASNRAAMSLHWLLFTPAKKFH